MVMFLTNSARRVSSSLVKLRLFPFSDDGNKLISLIEQFTKKQLSRNSVLRKNSPERNLKEFIFC